MTFTVIKCPLYPTTEQEDKLQSTLDICRNLYNHFIFETRVAFKENDDKITFDEMQRIIPSLTKGKEVYSKAAQPVVDRFYRNLSVMSALRKQGYGVGKLRFKSKEQFKTFVYNQIGFKLIGNKLKLSKIGSIKINLHCRIEGKIKEIQIKHESTGKWFACIVCEKTFVTECSLERKKIIGIDMGIKNFTYDSAGHVIENPQYLRHSEKKLAKAQRIFSRRVKGSANRNKQRVKVAKIHEKITNQRKDFLHKVSRQYVKNYDTIFVEDLHVENMKQNHKLAKSISDASWSMFFNYLEYKAARAGTLFRKVSACGTSQRCSRCSKTVKKSLAIRTHCCQYCGLTLDRDHNAALNIKQAGIDSLPLEWREVTPVEIASILAITNGEQVRSVKQETMKGSEFICF